MVARSSLLEVAEVVVLPSPSENDCRDEVDDASSDRDRLRSDIEEKSRWAGLTAVPASLVYWPASLTFSPSLSPLELEVRGEDRPTALQLGESGVDEEEEEEATAKREATEGAKGSAEDDDEEEEGQEREDDTSFFFIGAAAANLLAGADSAGLTACAAAALVLIEGGAGGFIA